MHKYADEMSNGTSPEPSSPHSPEKPFALVFFAWLLALIVAALIVVPLVVLTNSEANGVLLIILIPALPIYLLVAACAFIAALIAAVVLIKKGQTMHGILTLSVITSMLGVCALFYS